MGLTLNTNSLNLASSGGSSAASGVSTSDVTTLIKNNTPWQYIETLTANSTVELDFTNSNISTFDTFYIHFDNVNLTANAQCRMQLYIDSSLKTDTAYRTTSHVGSNTNSTNTGSSSLNAWLFGGQSYTWMRNITGAMYVGGKSGNVKVLQSTLAAANSGDSAIRHDVGGQYNSNLTGTITGFRIFPNTGNFSSGQFHLYGMNKHD